MNLKRYQLILKSFEVFYWKDRLGQFVATRIRKFEVADQREVDGEVCGPLMIQIEGFDSIFSEVVFLD